MGIDLWRHDEIVYMGLYVKNVNRLMLDYECL